MAASRTDSRSRALYARACEVLAGGVNSPVRAMRAIGRDPIFIERGAGAEIFDTDGNAYVDYVCSWGALIAGHAHPAVLEAVVRRRRGRHQLRRADRAGGGARGGGRARACRASRCCG